MCEVLMRKCHFISWLSFEYAFSSSIALRGAVSLLLPHSLACQMLNLILNVLPNATLPFRAPIYLQDTRVPASDTSPTCVLLPVSLKYEDTPARGIDFFSTFDPPVPQIPFFPLSSLPTNVRCRVVVGERGHRWGWVNWGLSAHIRHEEDFTFA